MTDRCVCGHRKYDHLGAGRCNEGTRRCRCDQFSAQLTRWDEDKEAGAIG
jgi:hypothetical protein